MQVYPVCFSISLLARWSGISSKHLAELNTLSLFHPGFYAFEYKLTGHLLVMFDNK